MEILYKDILLRDYRESDIADDIRWMNVDVDWIRADTPWAPIERVDPEAFRQDMKAYLANMPEDEMRWRLEIEHEGRHIGFVSSYLLDEHFDWVPPHEAGDPLSFRRAISIAVCASDMWGRGLGTRALKAFMDYYRERGIEEFYIETWSGNGRMLRCAEKLGFRTCKKEPGVHTVGGKKYDALVMRKK
ncbi:MAG: GNAT family protein [Clostridia bacterium]|nr:GNAT family protein [Clostridia bacterium]